MPTHKETPTSTCRHCGTNFVKTKVKVTWYPKGCRTPATAGQREEREVEVRTCECDFPGPLPPQR